MSRVARRSTCSASQDRAGRGTDRMQSYVPHKNLAEEAEVLLVKPGSYSGGVTIDRPVTAGPVRRFLRSLTRT